ncbi:nuclear transport factor 2 (NTF2) family protein [Tasmannia lanceolata]|uniref:nuclear transport factor 2 (NTF2) family protein n=1 Tax=Tasmannia lanceolata TaxID=3420 RepID=UPI00406308E6
MSGSVFPSPLALRFQATGKSYGAPIFGPYMQLRQDSLALCRKRLYDPKGMIYRRVYLKPDGRKPFCDRRPVKSGSSDLHSDPLRPSTTIELFYSSINNKNLEILEKLISDNCYFEELSFPDPFQGKQEVMYFLRELTNSMGKNTMFVIDRIYEGHGTIVGVTWHMEWQGKHIPFTRGCSFYEFLNQGDKLLIKTGRVVIETPVKPGIFALTLLKMISSLFDQFPEMTEKFLENHQILFQMLLKIYKMLIEPFLLSALVYYSHLWNFVASLLSFFVKILLKILAILKR